MISSKGGDILKNTRTVLVCITPQIRCKKLISAGNLTANQENAVMKIFCVLPANQSFSPDLEILEELNNASLEFNSELTVIFDDNPVDKISEAANQNDTLMLVTGLPGKNSSQFISLLCTKIGNIPLCMVDDDGTMYKVERNQNKKKKILI